MASADGRFNRIRHVAPVCPISFLFSSLPFLSIPLPFLLNPATGSLWERCKLPQRVGSVWSPPNAFVQYLVHICPFRWGWSLVVCVLKENFTNNPFVSSVPGHPVIPMIRLATPMCEAHYKSPMMMMMMMMRVVACSLSELSGSVPHHRELLPAVRPARAQNKAARLHSHRQDTPASRLQARSQPLYEYASSRIVYYCTCICRPLYWST